ACDNQRVLRIPDHRDDNVHRDAESRCSSSADPVAARAKGSGEKVEDIRWYWNPEHHAFSLGGDTDVRHRIPRYEYSVDASSRSNDDGEQARMAGDQTFAGTCQAFTWHCDGGVPDHVPYPGCFRRSTIVHGQHHGEGPRPGIEQGPENRTENKE